MSTNMTISISDYLEYELNIEIRKRKIPNKSEWVEELIRIGLADFKAKVLEYETKS